MTEHLTSKPACVCARVCEQVSECVYMCGVRSCLRQATWCHSWRAQPPETSYTHAHHHHHHHHTSQVEQAYKLLQQRYHLAIVSPAIFKAC